MPFGKSSWCIPPNKHITDYHAACNAGTLYAAAALIYGKRAA